MNKKLYVGNIVYEVTDDQLRTQFAQAGNVTTAEVVRYRDSGRSKGFGFVEMATEEEAQKAIAMFHEQDWLGRRMIVSEARPPKPSNNGTPNGRIFDGSQSVGSFVPPAVAPAPAPSTPAIPTVDMPMAVPASPAPAAPAPVSDDVTVPPISISDDLETAPGV